MTDYCRAAGNKRTYPIEKFIDDHIFILSAKQMAEVDPETLLEWLSMGQGDERDMQLIALEQLCMLLLMSDNVDRCFEM